MKLLDEEQKIRQEIFDYFGYVENWVVLPFEDNTEMYWILDGNEIRYNEDKENLLKDNNNGYSDTLWKSRYLAQNIFPGEDYIMFTIDTMIDSNQFLKIFTNAKKIEG